MMQTTTWRVIPRVSGLVILAALWLCAPVQAAPTPGAGSYDGARIVAERPLDGHGIELTIDTQAFAAPTKVQVFLPAGYETGPKRRWPVTYYLHGAQGDQTRFYPWYGKLIAGFPSILVAPDGGQIGFYSDWYNGGAGGPPMYETYDIDQLIPLIDARFRTIVTYAARHPDRFASAVSMSGAVDSNNPFLAALISGGPPLQGGQPDAIYGAYATEQVRWRGHNPTDLADNLRGVDLQVRTAEGTPTTTVDGPDPTSAVGCGEESVIFQTSTALHQHLVALGIPHLWKDYGAGCHSIPMFRREFADSLPGLMRVLAHPRPDPQTFNYRSIEPHFTVWGWRIASDPGRALEFLQMRGAGSSGVTLVGSGTTQVTTPPFFKGRAAVDVIAADGKHRLVPDRDGRLRFSVALGPAHSNQQDTAASQAAGDGTPGYFTSRTVAFAPHGRLRAHRDPNPRH
jgi:S-formylglutathione hydrolase FrmB